MKRLQHWSRLIIDQAILILPCHSLDHGTSTSSRHAYGCPRKTAESLHRDSTTSKIKNEMHFELVARRKEEWSGTSRLLDAAWHASYSWRNRSQTRCSFPRRAKRGLFDVCGSTAGRPRAENPTQSPRYPDPEGSDDLYSTYLTWTAQKTSSKLVGPLAHRSRCQNSMLKLIIQ